MMRYSEIPRDFSSDSLRFAELGEEQIYRNLRDDSPPSDISTHSGPALPLIAAENSSTTTSSSLSKIKDNKFNVIGGGGSNNSSSLINKNIFFTNNNYNNNTNNLNNNNCNYNYSNYNNITNNSKDTKDYHRSKKHSLGGTPQGVAYFNYGAGVTSTSMPSTATATSTPSYSQQQSISNCKSHSLPSNASIHHDYDSVIISALRVTPEELAGQITLLDFIPFSLVQPDELTSCAWTKKDKHIVAPNIVNFTKRFNHTSFWTVQEILSGQTAKCRAEILSHFIKVAKKLYEHNNLHSLFAIVSAMQSASIFRLAKTWSCLSKKDKQTFDRLTEIFNDRNNWANLREYLESLKLPCIPYLGLFLTDLVYIDLAHPHSGGLESEQRRLQMNNILRVISNYQNSDYNYIQKNVRIEKYLQSIRYIEELQNIFEEDQYKKSLKLEPPISAMVTGCGLTGASANGANSGFTKESLLTTHCSLEPSALASLNLSPAKSTSGSMRLSSATTAAAKFIPGHRKCRSLGTKFRSTSLPRNFHQNCHCPAAGVTTTIGVLSSTNRCKCRIFSKTSGTSGSAAATSSSSVAAATSALIDAHNEALHQSRNLIDDSVLEDKPLSDATSTGSSDGVVGYDNDTCEIIQDAFGFQGCIRRKTVLKDGRKPAVASWQRYWLQIWANSLVYFPPKSFKGTERSDFKREPCKVCSLDGWTSQSMDNPQQINTFQLINISMGTIYKIRTGSPKMTTLWLDALRRVSQQNTEKPLPANLMSFE